MADIPSDATHRLSEMNIHFHSLLEAAQALPILDSFTTPEERGSHLSHLLWTGLSVAYSRCFRDTPHKLDPEAVFAGRTGGKEAHQHLVTMRSKHFAHDINDRRQSLVAMLLDGDGNLLEIAEQQSLPVHDWLDLQNARQLIADAQSYVEAERERLREVIRLEVAAIAPETLLAMPEPIFRQPRMDRVASGRRAGRKAKSDGE